jgi:hypothetical protein
MPLSMGRYKMRMVSNPETRQILAPASLPSVTLTGPTCGIVERNSSVSWVARRKRLATSRLAFSAYQANCNARSRLAAGRRTILGIRKLAGASKARQFQTFPLDVRPVLRRHFFIRPATLRLCQKSLQLHIAQASGFKGELYPKPFAFANQGFNGIGENGIGIGISALNDQIVNLMFQLRGKS